MQALREQATAVLRGSHEVSRSKAVYPALETGQHDRGLPAVTCPSQLYSSGLSASVSAYLPEAALLRNGSGMEVPH